MAAGNWVALAGIMLTLFLAALAGGIRFIDARVDRGDSRLASAIDLLTLQLQQTSAQLAEVRSDQSGKLDQIVYQVTHLNDGGTVKGQLTNVVARVIRLEDNVQLLREERHG